MVFIVCTYRQFAGRSSRGWYDSQSDRDYPLEHKPRIVAPLAAHFHTDRPHYVPVSKRNTETVEFHIRADTGHDIPFIAEKVIVKLHFRLKIPEIVWICLYRTIMGDKVVVPCQLHQEQPYIFYLLQRRLARVCYESERRKRLEFWATLPEVLRLKPHCWHKWIRAPPAEVWRGRWK